MADLDDFFAKKDRKKSKSKKFATADELAKKLDEPKQKVENRPKKERPAQDGEDGVRGEVEEEWKDYEETVKDYTGLKIQVLQGNNAAQNESGFENTTEDSGSENNRGRGPWNKTQSEPEQQAAAPPPPVERKEPKPTTGTYIAPSARREAAAAAAPIKRNQQPKNAPDIHNDDYFPQLGASGGKRLGGWSTSSSGATNRPQAHSQPLSLGNRFTALHDDS